MDTEFHSFTALETDLSLWFERVIEVFPTKNPFTELILSWNGWRPEQGFWTFSVSFFREEWSEFIPLADWGKLVQKSYCKNSIDSFISSYQDLVRVKEGLCTGYRIKVTANKGATLEGLCSVTASISQPSLLRIEPIDALPSVELKEVQKISQHCLPHPRAKDLCSPVSTTAAINFLMKNHVNPVDFSDQVYDQEFAIYGNWVLNTAAAFTMLNGKYRTYVTRLQNFKAVHNQLTKGLPVVVSVKGPLFGAPLPYANGHLILITGYDSKQRKVLCMDCGHPSDETTRTSYDLDAFLFAWTQQRQNLAYIFETTGEAIIKSERDSNKRLNE